jgi:hypothetical protein
MKRKTLPVGVILIGLLIAAVCSILLVPHRASGQTTAHLPVRIHT